MTEPTPDHAAPRRKWWTLKRRRWAYGVLIAAGGVAVAHGVATAEQLATWLALGGALLGVGGLALANPTAE